MARNKSAFVIAAEYYPIRGLFWFFNRLPFTVSAQLAEWIFRGVLFFIPKRRRLMQRNLELCFPERSPDDCRDIARRSIHNIAQSMALIPRLPTVILKPSDTDITIDGQENFSQAAEQKLGVLSFTAHYGCWEAIAPYLPRVHPLTGVVVRPLDNPRLDRLVAGIRTSGGTQVIPRNRVVRDGLKLLRDKGFLGLLIDQNLAHGGTFVNFFGRPAATTTIISILARRTGSPIIPVRSRWQGRMLHIRFYPPMPLSLHSDPEKAIWEDTQRMTSIIEGWIREDPGQWLWLHNRWKRQPTPEEWPVNGRAVDPCVAPSSS